jgi:hypothetical protein
MAVTAFLYGNCIANAFGSTSSGNSPNMDLLSDTIKVMLCTSTYTPNQDTHQFKSDVTNEVTGTGYSAGGTTLTTKVLSYTAGTNVIMFDADDATWAASTITARYAVIYDSTPATDATRPLIGYVDFGADVSSSAGNFTITWSTSGIFTVTVS